MMSEEKMTCPKCQGRMLQGFVPDYSHASIFVGSWQAGKPKKSFWTVAKAPRADGVPIGAFRCEKCGFLEFYSDPRFAAE
jgi:hypothetical protein